MKSPIHAIPQLYRNLKRWTEILSVLSKYGLADWISRLNVEFVKDSLRSAEGDSLARQSHEARVRMALSELGPTFIKLGQLLSARADVVGVKLASELGLLLDQVAPENFATIQSTVESELGQSLEEMFSSFEEKATAAASIGQVHRARLADGQEVAVKVQRTGVQRKINDDLEILSGLAQLA
ncbi:MAG: AarF/UbiB family protein, partial [Planctomycetota bacterium]|nr:AarF/UbiB family protein [Planctomycetota bacterium]